MKKISIVPEKIRAYMNERIRTVEDVEKWCDWSGPNYLPLELGLKNGGTVTNLVPGEKYELCGECFEVTHEYPRTLNISGLDNTRDLGNGIIKYGRAFRGSTLKNLAPHTLDTMKKLGIKTELDLSAGETCDFAKENFKYYGISVKWYNLIFSEKDYLPAYADALRVFADKENYPIYFHCTLGRDRTGCVAMMLLALCGMSIDDCYHEHFLTWFSSKGDGEKAGIPAHFANIDAFFSLLMSTKGPEYSLYENAEAFVKSIGLTDDEIAAIKRNLTE